ncbi:dachshund homolog 1-like isoform X2 [Toxorhynchites rutilus septentrionalis]|nr:dachshund homolog 1-like isoform X2 [Toxorhynchites rutilus septentrionalis]
MDKMKQNENGVGDGGGGGGGGGSERGGGSSSMGCDEFHSEFYNTGRIGRRNALPDILGTHCTTTTADLSTQMGALTTSDCPEKATSTGSTMMTNSTKSSSNSGS